MVAAPLDVSREHEALWMRALHHSETAAGAEAPPGFSVEEIARLRVQRRRALLRHAQEFRLDLRYLVFTRTLRLRGLLTDSAGVSDGC